jgi:hypothetical protein
MEADVNFRKYFTIVDFIVIVFMLCFMAYFGPKACMPIEANAQDYNQLQQSIKTAKQTYYKNIDNDFTDSGCIMAELQLKHDIDLILSHFKSQILKEVAYDEINPDSELELDRHAAWLDAKEFQD